jgi:hypothetical protein
MLPELIALMFLVCTCRLAYDFCYNAFPFRHATDVERKPLYFPYVRILLGDRKVKFGNFSGPATLHNIF